jgi:hypothetical protein
LAADSNGHTPPPGGLIAFDLGQAAHVEEAKRRRDWMVATPDKFANLCLPLVVACESGWWLRLHDRVEATWSGGIGQHDLVVEGPASSHFGSGVVTFHVNVLFRTPPGVQLLVKGPANWIKDGVQALEGIVETEWAVATFTMNWKLTRPGTVVWEAGEPYCQVAPIRLSDQALPLDVRPLDAETLEQYEAWATSRGNLNAAGGLPRQLDYMRGESPGGAGCPAGAHTRVIRRR